MGSEEAVKAEDDFGKKIEFIGVQEHSNRRDKIVRFYFTREDGNKVEFTYLSKKDMLQVLSENIGVSENEKGGILAYMQNKYKPKPIEKQSQASQGKPSQTHSLVFAQQPEQSIEQRVEQAAHGEPILSPEERFMYNLEKCTSLYDAVERALGKIMANESLDKKEIEVISTYFATSKDLPEQYKQGLAERDKEIIAIKDFSKFMKENQLERIQESNEEVRKECKVKTDELIENYESKLGELQGENLLQKEKYELKLQEKEETYKIDTEHLNFRVKDLEFELSSLKLEKELGRPLNGEEVIEHAFGLPLGATLDGKTEDAAQSKAEQPEQQEVAEPPKPEAEQQAQEPIATGPKEYLYTKVKYVPGWFKKYHVIRGENTDAIRVRVNSKVIYGNYFCEVDGLPYRFNLVYAEDKRRNIELKQEEIAPEVLEQIVRDAVEAGLLPLQRLVAIKAFMDDDSDMGDEGDELLRKTEPVKPEYLKPQPPEKELSYEEIMKNVKPINPEK